jgi:fructose-1,6-bisphosphatase/inositol monophosphatase family enzyme
VDPERVADLIREAVRAEIMPRFAKLAAHEVREKSLGELVTVADEATEAWLDPQLAGLLPGSVVLGEEAAAADPALIARLVQGDDPVWMIDPVDGTSNFAAGKPTFAVMVALARHGELLAGWIYEPVPDVMAMAEHGAGATVNGARARVATVPQEERALRGPVIAGTFGSPELAERMRSRRERVDAVKSMRCAGAEYIRLATGEYHFAVFTRLMPWDHAPGVIIHREAGGYSAHDDGAPYIPGDLGAGALMLAPDRETWRRLHRILMAP